MGVGIIMSSLSVSKYLLALYVLACLELFSASFLPITPTEFKAAQSILFAVIVLFTLRMKIEKTAFTLPFAIIVAGMFFSTYMGASMHEEQTIAESIRATLPRLMAYSLFFLLCKIRPGIEWTEKFIFMIGAISALLVIQVWLLYPNVLFGHFSENNIRGIRMIVAGDTFKMALFFFCINILMIKKKKIWVFLLLVTTMSIILGIARQIIILSAALSVFFVMKNSNLFKKILFAIAVAIVFSFVTDTEIYQRSKEYTENEAYKNRGGENIRITALKYYVNDAQENIITRILGNGDFAETSVYGKKSLANQKRTLCFPTDVGWAYFYHVYGLFGILGLLMIAYRTYKMPLPFRYHYLKYAVYYLMFSFIASGSLLYYSQCVVLPFLCYLMDKASKLNQSVIATEMNS